MTPKKRRFSVLVAGVLGVACATPPLFEPRPYHPTASPAPRHLFVGDKRACLFARGDVARCWGDIPDRHAAWNVATLVDSTTDALTLAIARSSEEPCVIHGGGVVTCRWGERDEAVIGLEGALRVAGGMQHTCAVRRDGTVWCWGDLPDRPYERGRPRFLATQVAGWTNVVKLALGGWHTCALHDDGRVSCLGENSSGQIGDGAWSDSFSPRLVPGIDSVVDLAAGFVNTCALRRDGTVRCWGAERNLAAVDGARQPSTPRVIEGVHDVTEIAVGTGFGCGLARSGEVVCWAVGQPEPGPRLGAPPVRVEGLGADHAGAAAP